VGARARQADRPRSLVVPGLDGASRRAAGRRAAPRADDDGRPALHRGVVRALDIATSATRSGAQHRDHLGAVRSAAAGRPGCRPTSGSSDAAYWRAGLASRARRGQRATARRRLPLGDLRRCLAAGAREWRHTRPARSRRGGRRRQARRLAHGQEDPRRGGAASARLRRAPADACGARGRRRGEVHLRARASGAGRRAVRVDRRASAKGLDASPSRATARESPCSARGR
jgi:hypothetical protein